MPGAQSTGSGIDEIQSLFRLSDSADRLDGASATGELTQLSDLIR